MSEDDYDLRETDVAELYRNEGKLERLKQPVIGMDRFGTQATVETWKCRACGRGVDVTATAVELLAIMNRLAVKMNAEPGARRIEPMEGDDCCFCPSCRKVFEAKQAEGRAHRDAKITEMLQRLRPEHNSPPHVLREAEDYVRKFASDGDGIVRHYIRKREEYRSNGSRSGKV